MNWNKPSQLYTGVKTFRSLWLIHKIVNSRFFYILCPYSNYIHVPRLVHYNINRHSPCMQFTKLMFRPSTIIIWYVHSVIINRHSPCMHRCFGIVPACTRCSLLLLSGVFRVQLLTTCYISRWTLSIKEHQIARHTYFTLCVVFSRCQNNCNPPLICQWQAMRMRNVHSSQRKRACLVKLLWCCSPLTNLTALALCIIMLWSECCSLWDIISEGRQLTVYAYGCAR